MPLRFSHVQSSWPWSIYSFNWGRLHLKHWEKGGSIQILPFSGQFSNGTRLMPCFLSISHRRREVWQRMRCIPAGSVTSLPGEQKPRGFPRGKNHKTSAEQVHSPWWAPHHRTCASQAIRRGPAGYTACSPPRLRTMPAVRYLHKAGGEEDYQKHRETKWSSWGGGGQDLGSKRFH